MKKFILKLFLMSCCVIVVFLCLNEFYRMKNENDVNHTAKFLDIPHEIQVANLGSSHGLLGFCYDDVNTDCTCFNFGLESQSLDYDNRLLHYYQNDLSKGGTLFIIISYFSFYGEDESTKEDYEALNQRYYDILPEEYIKGYRLKNMILSRFPLLTAKEKSIQVFFGNSCDHNEELWNRCTNAQEALEDAVSAYERHIGCKYDNSGNLIYNEANIHAVYEIVSLCREKGIRPILVTTPYMNEYNQLVPDSFLAQFHEKINEIKSELCIEYYDYACDLRFVNDYSLFMNSDHLNQTGAKKFTDIIFEEVLDQKDKIVVK